MNEDVEESRERLSTAMRETRSAFDFPRRIQRSFRQQPAVWVIGAVLVGVAVVMIPRRKVVYVNDGKKSSGKSKVIETGFLLGAARIAATLLKPVVLNFVRERFINAAGRRKRGPWD
jgi:hypothetical protein